MKQEAYVSFEVAKLLKEKGFDEPCHYYYHNQELKFDRSLAGRNSYQHSNNVFSAPTHQTAMDWLRKKHKLFISIDITPIYGKVKDEKGGNTCGLLYWLYIASGEWMNDKYNPQQKAFVVSDKSFKKAADAALKHTLENLI